MTLPQDRSLVTTGEQSLGGRYRLLLLLARATVFWERLWARAWKPVLLAASFAAVVLLDVLPELPGWLHLTVLVAFVVAFVALSIQAAKGFQAVDRAAARRRLERDNDLAHRPLSGLADRPVSTGDGLSLKIWLAHVRALTAKAQRLTLRPPAPGLAARDPYAIRLVVLLALVIGVAAGYGEAGPRLARAMTPGSGADDSFAVEIWLTPPSYSRRPAIFLSNETSRDTGQGRIDVPTGSTLSARVTGRPAWYAADPTLEIGGRAIPFGGIGTLGNDESESFRGETTLKTTDGRDQRINILANGDSVASWLLAVVPDLPPKAEFDGPPERDSRFRLRFAYTASDDYSVEDLKLEIRLQDRALLAGDDVTRLDLPMAGAASDRRRLKGQSSLDLTAHPWAGLPVQLRLIAGDGAAQEGASEAIKIVLPERQFKHPVARAIIVQRRRLALLEPESRQKIERDVMVGLELIKAKPLAYESSVTVFLALGVAQARLLHSQDDGKYRTVMDLLWNTAIGLEDGGLAVARRELEQARDDLRDALARNAEIAEIDRLMDRTAQALENYLMALAEKIQAEGGAEMEFDPMMRMLGAGDLREMLDRARDLARTGATDAARRMLSELGRVLEGIQGALQGGSALAAMNEALQQFGEMLSRARQLTEHQQELLDDSFADISTETRKTQTQSANATARQRALRRDLGQLMLDADKLLGAIPPALGRADLDMMGAVEGLGQGRLPEALGRQTGAVKNLRQAVDEMSAQMAQMMAGAFGFSPGSEAGGQMPGGRDPFGRLTGQGGIMPGGAIGIPERGQIHRSRQILDELRRRAGQNRRPKPERDYIERLLKKF